MTEIEYAIKRRVREIGSTKAGDDRPSKRQKESADPLLLTEIECAIKKRVREIGSPKAGGDSPSKRQKKSRSATVATENLGLKTDNDVALTFEDERFDAAVRRHVQGLEGNICYQSVANRVLRELKKIGRGVLLDNRLYRKSRDVSLITAYTQLSDDDANESEFDLSVVI